MLKIGTTILLLFCSLASFAQSTTGFYLTKTCIEATEKKNVAITGDRVCITDQPIITYSEIESIGPLKTKGEKFSFDIVLTETGNEKIGILATSLVDPYTALVVEGEIFAVIPLSKLEKKKIYRLNGSMHYYQTVHRVHSTLKNLVENN